MKSALSKLTASESTTAKPNSPQGKSAIAKGTVFGLISDRPEAERELREAMPDDAAGEIMAHPLDAVAAGAFEGVPLSAVFLELGDVAHDKRIETPLRRSQPHTPVIVLVDGPVDTETARRAVRFGAQDLLERPLDRDGLTASLDSLEPAHRGGACNVTAVHGAVGGAGATSFAITLAAEIASDPEAGRVSLVDLDLLSGAVGLHLDASGSHDLEDVLGTPERVDAAYLEVVMKETHGMRVLSFHAPHLAFRAEATDLMMRVLDVLEETSDRMVLDIPHYAPGWMRTVLPAVNQAYLITTASVPALKVGRDRLREFAAIEGPPGGLQPIVNQFHRRPFSNELDKQAVSSLLGETETGFLRVDRDTLLEAANRGVAPQIVRRNAGFVKDIRRLVRQDDTAKTSRHRRKRER